MAKQSIGLGSVADDGTGDTLRIAGDKVNDNFDEIYTALGDGSTLTTPAPTASPTFTGTITGASQFTLLSTQTASADSTINFNNSLIIEPTFEKSNTSEYLSLS